ncbi:MAG: peptidylprolyl isomerase [Bacteroidota bacterium]
MALLNRIRERSGLAVGIIAFGLILFLLGAEFLNPASTFFNSNDVGEIDGVSISPDRYQAEIDNQNRLFALRTSRNPSSEQETSQVRNQAWLQLITDVAFGAQYDALGVVITPDEVYDMVQGNNIDPTVQSYFRNPQTGQFDPNFVSQYFQGWDNLPADERARWQVIENTLVDGRYRIKYESLIINSTYVTSAEAKRNYEQANAVAEARYLYVPYYSIPDSAITISDSDLRNYYNENKEEYKVDRETRSISYVRFPLVASAADSISIREELTMLANDFSTAENDSSFARRNSSSRVGFYEKYTKANMPAVLEDEMDDLFVGDVVGPVLEGSNYVVYKVSDIYEDTTAVARASHILIRNESGDDAGKEAAREQAQDLIRQIRGGAAFADLAAEFGTDGTAQRGGDLGWFDESTMVAEFSEAVFGASRTGLINTPVETQFGFHVIDITEAPQYTAYKLAKVDLEITASTATEDEAYRSADALRANAGGNLSGFENAAVAAGVQVLAADNIDANAYNVSGMRNARQMVRWLFNDASVGDVGDQIFEAGDSYVIAAMSSIQEEGYLPFESVRAQVEAQVRKDKKAEAIITKLGDVQNSTIDDLASSYGSDASINNSTNLRLNSNSMTGIGFAPKALGVTFGLDEGEISAPVQENNGVVVVQLEAKTAATEQPDYSGNRTTLLNQQRSANTGAIAQAIEDQAKIKDTRYVIE